MVARGELCGAHAMITLSGLGRECVAIGGESIRQG